MPTTTSTEPQSTKNSPGGSAPAAGATVDDLMARLRSPDDSVRGPAWQGAARHGAPAVRPLAAAMTDAELETARAAKRALWVIVRHAGRPGAAREAQAVAKELLSALASPGVAVRREILWMLSEIGDDGAIAPISALLTDSEVRQDAVAALMRLPGRKATAALSKAFRGAPEDFKPALADALRRRGESVQGYPSQKLVPTRTTAVKHPPPA